MQGRDQVFLAELGCSPVLADHASGDSLTEDRGVQRDHGGRSAGRRVSAEAQVLEMVIEMVHILVEDSVGVSLVVDQQPVGALLANGTNEPLDVAVRPGCSTTIPHR